MLPLVIMIIDLRVLPAGLGGGPGGPGGRAAPGGGPGGPGGRGRGGATTPTQFSSAFNNHERRLNNHAFYEGAKNLVEGAVLLTY